MALRNTTTTWERLLPDVVLVDTSAFYALADVSDAHHVEAKAYYAQSYPRLDFVTTDYILLETWILLRYRMGRSEAMTFWQGLRSGIIPVLAIQHADLERAFRIAQDYSDQDFSLIDCAAFAFMERCGIKSAFSFDAHFTFYRYGRGRRNAFQRVP